MKTYHGRREGYTAIVTVDGTPLNPRLDLWNHSPTGFEWGCGGSGLYQLQQCTNLTSAAWQNVGAPTTATSATNIISGTAFYRVQSLPNP